MKKIKILSVLVAVSFVFNIADYVFAAVGNISDKNSPQGALQLEFKTPAQFEENKNIDISGQHKVSGIKREGGKYYLSFSAGSKTFWLEVTGEEDKNEIDAYDRKDLGLYVDIPKGAEAKEGIVSKYTTIYNPDSYSPTHHASDINVNGLTVTDIHKETVKVPTGRSPIEKEMYVGTVTTETGRNIYVEVPEEYVGKNITASINISDKDYVDYSRGEKDKHIISKENVKFDAATDVSGQHKVSGIKREDGKYYLSFSAGSKTFWLEVTKEEDKNEIDAYDRKDLGLYVDIPKGAEAKEGIVSKYTTIYNPDSYNPTAHASDINVNGLTVTDIHKETVNVPTGRSPEAKETYIGTVTTETGRRIYVEIPEGYVGKELTASINISDKDFVNYYKGDNGKYVIPNGNVKFDVTTNEVVNTNTYSSIGVVKNKKGEPAYLQIKKEKGSVVKVNIKGMSTSQINSLKKYFNENLKNKDITSKEAKNALNNLKKNANDIIKGNTYSKVNVLKSNKGEPAYLQIKNKKGEVLAKIDIKGMNNKQINSLKKYFNTNLKNESKNSKEAKSALNILNKKADEFKKANSKEEKNKKKNKIIDLLKKFFPNF